MERRRPDVNEILPVDNSNLSPVENNGIRPVPSLDAVNNLPLSNEEVIDVLSYLPVLEQRSEEERLKSDSGADIADPISQLLKGNGAFIMEKQEEDLVAIAHKRLLNNIEATNDAEKKQQYKDMLTRVDDIYLRGYLRLAINIAKKYRNRGVSFQDLIQEANMGILDAMRKFDPEKGYRFSTYATYWIRQHIGRTIQDTSTLIRLPVHVRESIQKVTRVMREIEIATGEIPSPQEIAYLTGFTEEKVMELLEAQTRSQTRSLDDVLPNSDDAHTLNDIIPDEKSTHEEVERELLTQDIQSVLEPLSPREREVINMRFGLKGQPAYSLKEIADEFGLSRERIRQIESKALNKLRRTLNGHIKDYLDD